MTSLANFDDLLSVARAQTEPQRLLFVLATAGLSDDATVDERARFEAGEGGTLTPLACIAKALDELSSFEALRDEASLLDRPWDIVFVGALANALDAEEPMQRMVDSIKSGRIGGFAAFDATGEPVRFR